MNKEKELNEVSYDASTDEDFDKRSLGESIEDETGKIVEYRFKIFVRNSAPLEGTLSREQMELIYRNYSSEGANLTQKIISRDFPYTLSDFKRILKAFKITKASIPFPPHMLKERTTEELVELAVQQKEIDYIKRYEQDKVNLFADKYKNLIIEHQKLKDSYLRAEYLTKDIQEIPYVVEKPNVVSGGKDIIIYLSDIHIGAYVSTEGVYDNSYDEQEVNRRLSKVLEKISSYQDLNQITIVNLGDAIDGYNAQTTRSSSTHLLPQNMSNKEQGKVLLRQLTGFFRFIIDNIPHNKLSFFSVGHSNHGGDFEHSIITALSIMLETMGVQCYVATRPIDHFTIGNKTIIYCHGKDNSDMFKNMPLVLNDKTELYLNEYIHHHKLSGEIIVVKGDLHQSATTYGKLFKYKSVGSLFGSSNWIHANFGNTRWCCDYTIIDEQGDMIDGIIKDK